MAVISGRELFGTDRRIRLGIWGLGRGMHFYHQCRMLNMDVVAGCDYNAHMRDAFLKANPGAFVTADDREFLAGDFDAVLLATFCPGHAMDAIRCLEAGKHVLSEVTSFHTMSEGVALVEAVEKSGLVYNLAENYPFSKANMHMADLWGRGLFGELMYAEYEYVHECRVLAYTYIDGVPVIPGNTVHNWRSWLNFHYYNTHSLGPAMIISGTRPERVTALPGGVKLAGYLMNPEDGMGGVNPSLINMSGGGIMRNLMGSTTNDTHAHRMWGTRGSFEIGSAGVFLRLGAAGSTPKMKIRVDWPVHGKYAEAAGHGGGDFWILYYFAREILTGEPAPFDIYKSCDCTIPGILAVKSASLGGQPIEVPDFRNRRERKMYRQDNFDQKRYNVRKGCFPKGADPEITGRFTSVMKELIQRSIQVRAVLDWISLYRDVEEKEKVRSMTDDLIRDMALVKKTMKDASVLAGRYPGSDAARVLGEMLEIGSSDEVLGSGFAAKIRRARAGMK